MKKYRFGLPLRTLWARTKSHLGPYVIFSLLTLLGVLAFILPSYLSPQLQVALFAVIGTLIGAIASYIGGAQIQRDQVKASFVVNRKNSIYVPLYNELGRNDEILEAFPYPFRFVVKESDRRINPLPEILEWTNIRNDERYFQLPYWLEKAMSEYDALVSRYVRTRDKASDELQACISTIFLEMFQTTLRLPDIMSHVLPRFITKGELLSVIRERIDEKPPGRLPPQYTDDQLKAFERRVIEEAKKLTSINELIAIQKDIVYATRKIRGQLKTAIAVVIRRFEMIDESF